MFSKYSVITELELQALGPCGGGCSLRIRAAQAAHGAHGAGSAEDVQPRGGGHSVHGKTPALSPHITPAVSALSPGVSPGPRASLQLRTQSAAVGRGSLSGVTGCTATVCTGVSGAYGGYMSSHVSGSYGSSPRSHTPPHSTLHSPGSVCL
uniref:Uncharacterized protein n=1 Tax=Knipowitschia caucasica TaxID=637954 RepID=A0AAV2KCJ4_KNICA